MLEIYNAVPVEVGDRMGVRIISTGDQGDGIAKINNFTVIVKGGVVGEWMRIEIERVHATYAFAKVIG